MTLSTRELAVAIWLAIIVCWVLSRADIRKSLAGVWTIAFQWKLAVPFLVCIAYAASVVWLLFEVGLWRPTDLKETIIWYIASGCTAAFSGVQMQSRVPSIRQIVKDQVGALIVVEYLIAAFTFSIWVELLLVPTVTFIALIDAFAQTKTEYASVRKVTGGLLAVIGFAVAGAALRDAFLALGHISLVSIARELALPVVLTVSLLPIAYAFFVISAYEQIFVRVDLGVKDPVLRRYVRRRLLRSMLLSPTRIRRFIDLHRGRFITASSKTEIDRWLETVG